MEYSRLPVKGNLHNMEVKLETKYKTCLVVQLNLSYASSHIRIPRYPALIFRYVPPVLRYDRIVLSSGILVAHSGSDTVCVPVEEHAN